MANAIDLVVAQQAIDQLKNLIVQLDLVDAKMTAISANAITLSTNAGKVNTPGAGAANAGGNAGVNSELSAQAALNKKLADSIALLQAKYTELTRVRGNGKKTLLEEQAAVRESLRLATLAAKGVNDEVTAYQKLDAEYKKAVLAAKQLGAVHGSTSTIFIKEAASVNKLADELKAIDGRLGNHTRSVGNYASGWNGLSNSINQLTREAPAFANSMQTGFMALSNNIPILVDELNNLKRKNVELKNSGEKTENVFKTVAKSFFSWQTLISVGVTLLTLYGAKLIDMIKGLGGVEDALKSLIKTQKLSDSLISDTTRNIEHQIELEKDRAKIKGATQDELNAIDLDGAKRIQKNLEDVRDARLKELNFSKKYRSEAGDSLIKKNKQELDENIAFQKLLNNSRAFWTDKEVKQNESLTETINKLRIRRERIKTASDDKIFEELTKQHTNAENAVKLHGQKITAMESSNDAALKTRKVKSTKDIDKLAEDARVRAYEADISDLERKKEITSDELNVFRGGINERIQISTQFALRERDIVNRRYEEAKRLAKGNDDLLVVATNDQITALENTISDNAKRIAGFYKDVFGEAKNAFPDTVFGDKYKMTQEQKEDLKEHERRVKEVADSMRNYLGSFVSDFGSNSGLTETMNILSGEVAGFGKDFAVTFNAIAEAGQEVFNKISQASQANFEGEYKRLQSQKEIALQFAGDSDFAKERIEMQAEERRKQIANREFKAKQKMAIFNIAIDTAQAIVSTYAQVPKFDFGISATALAIAIGGIGAVQIAAVAAQKVPQYFEGGTHDGGLMMVNDAKGSNYKETIVTPDGKIIKPEGRDVVMNAPKGTQIFTPEQWQEKELHNMLQSKGISMNESYNSNSGLTYQEMDAILGKHFKNITTQTTTFDKKGFSSYSVSKGNKTIRNENRASGQGFKV